MQTFKSTKNTQITLQTQKNRLPFTVTKINFDKSVEGWTGWISKWEMGFC